MDIKELKVSDFNNISRHPWEYARAKVILDIIKNSSPSVIVDIGCGDIFIAEQLSKNFPSTDFYCVDTAFDNSIIDYYTKKHNNGRISLYKSIVELNSKDIKADIVLLLDVIEHIDNDTAFLSEIINKPFVTKDTQILITVPAFQSLYTMHDKWIGHQRRYNLKTLNDIAIKLQLSVLKTNYFFFSLIIYRYVQKISEKITKPAESSQEGIGNYKTKWLLDKLFYYILLIDYHCIKMLQVLSIKIPGLSCMALLKKRQ